MTKITESHKKLLKHFFELEFENGVVMHDDLKKACNMRGQFVVKLFNLIDMNILKMNNDYVRRTVTIECVDENIRVEYEPKIEFEPIEMSREEELRRDMEIRKNARRV